MHKQLKQYISQGEDLQRKRFGSSSNQQRQDSSLVASGWYSQYAYEQGAHALLLQQEQILSVQASILSKQSEIEQLNYQILRSHRDEQEELEASRKLLEVQENELRNELRQWQERYLIVSTSAGVLDYLGFWRENDAVGVGTELFAIVPKGGPLEGEVIIPAIGVGKLRLGLDVQVKLNDYPYDEYGLIKGKLAYLSPMAHRISSAEGELPAYRLRVTFPTGLRTNYGYVLPYKQELRGRAEIIARPKKLIERLFDNLKSQVNK